MEVLSEEEEDDEEKRNYKKKHLIALMALFWDNFRFTEKLQVA